MNEPRWRRYLRFRGPDTEADIEDELSFHLEMREWELLAEGRTAEQAREEALARFGNVKEVRDWLRRHDGGRQRRHQWGETLDEWRRDLRYGARKLRQHRGFTLAVILVIALGIGATTAVFSAVDAILLRPLPFHDGERLARLEYVGIPQDFGSESYTRSTPLIDDVAAQPGLFSGLAVYAPGGMNLSGTAAGLRVQIGMVTPSFFTTLGVLPAIGSPFTLDEGVQGAAPVTILSDGLWRRQFGGDPGVLGRTIELNGRAYRVVGVMPPGFSFPEKSELWLPLPFPITTADWEPFDQMFPSTVIGRLAPDVTIPEATSRLRALVSTYSSTILTDVTDAELVQPLREVLVGDRREALLILLGATALVLLVACGNVANLLLSRAASRRREIAMRSVLGATPARILRQLLVESLLLSVAGGAVGLVLAFAVLGPLQSLVPSGLAGAAELRIDGRVLTFAFALVMVTGIVFGLWPALAALRYRPGPVVRMGATSAVTGGETPHVRRLLVICELAMALMLLISAGVMLRSLNALLATDSGVRPENVATLEVSLARASFGTVAERQAFVRGVLERLEGNPQVEAAAMVNELPLRGEGGVMFGLHAEGGIPTSSNDLVYAQDARVTPDYFRAMGIPVLSGRSFTAGADSSFREFVINQELAGTLWPGQEALGKRVVLAGGERPVEVTGVVGDVSLVRIGDPPRPQMYLPLMTSPYPNLTLVARGRVPADLLATWLREAVQSASPGQPVYNVRTMEEVIASTVVPQRTQTRLVALFGVLALLLAAVGVYGVISYSVARRTREIGIRVALGAQPRRVVGQVMREGLLLTFVGVVAGLTGAWVLTRLLAGLLYGVGPRDPVAFLLAPAILIVIAALASLLPAMRAARVDPASVIKAE